MSNEMPSTACTAPTWRWKTPRSTGKCLTRFSTRSRTLFSDIARLSFFYIPPAGHLVLVPGAHQRRVLFPAAVEHVGAAGRKWTVRWFFVQQRRAPLDGFQVAALAQVQPRQAVQQAQGVGVLRVGVKFSNRRLLNDQA